MIQNRDGVLHLIITIDLTLLSNITMHITFLAVSVMHLYNVSSNQTIRPKGRFLYTHLVIVINLNASTLEGAGHLLRGGGATKWENHESETFYTLPRPSLFAHPLLKGEHFSHPPSV